MRIRAVTLREIRLPLREPFRISSGIVQERRMLLLELEDESGVTAWSECVAAESPNYSYETIDLAWSSLELWLVPAVLGRSFDGAHEIHGILEATARGHRMAKAALEMGSWGLEAETRGIPLAQLLGGTRDRLEVGVSLGIEETPEALVERALAAVESGYRKVKLKIAPGADVEYVRSVREAVGPDVNLMVDANAAYSLRDSTRLQELDAFGLTMIEQPLDGEDLLRHAELQDRLKTAICLDESITSADRAEDMIRVGAGRIINVKPGRVGGFSPSLSIHALCENAGVPLWCGGMLESGIGRAYNVALASLPGFTMPGDLSPSRRYWERDVVDPEWTMSSDGMVDVPFERPGIGVEVDRRRIEALAMRERRFTVT